MKKHHIVFLIILLSAMMGCKEKEQDTLEAPKKVLLSALQKLEIHDYDGYMQVADLGSITDSIQLEYMMMILNQHQEMQEKKKGNVLDTKIIGAKMVCDSVCTVYYQLTFKDNLKETCSQKMVKVNNDWKIRLRN